MKLDLDDFDMDDDIEDTADTESNIDWDAILSQSEDTEPTAQNVINLDKEVDNEVEQEPEFNAETAEEGGSKVSDTKKTAIMSICIGVGIIIICLIIVRIATHKPNTGQGSSQAGNMSVAGQEQVQEEPMPNAEANEQTAVPSPTVDQWTAVDQSIRLKTQKTGRFVVIDVTHYGTVIDDKIQTKSVAIGELVGYGTGYEMELPNSLALQLRNGSTITVKFKTGLINNQQVIGDIEPLASSTGTHSMEQSSQE